MMLVDGRAASLRPAGARDRQHPHACRRSAGWCGWTAGCTEGARVPQHGGPAAAGRGGRRFRDGRRATSSTTDQARGRRRWRAARPPGRPGVDLRGVATEVVEGTEHLLLPAQVGTPGGRILARDLRRLGTEVYTGTRAVRLTDDRPAARQRVRARDRPRRARRGRPAGDRPRPARWPHGAARRGRRLRATFGHRRTDPRDRRLRRVPRRSPPASWPPRGSRPGCWPATSTREPTPYAGSRTVARLRATGLDVAVLGDPGARRRARLVEMTNPIAGTAPQARRPGRRHRRRRPGRRPLAGRADHPALRPADRARRARAGSAARAREPGHGGDRAHRRGRGVCVRRRHRGRGSGPARTWPRCATPRERPPAAVAAPTPYAPSSTGSPAAV